MLFRSPVNKPLYYYGGAEYPGGPRVRVPNTLGTFEVTGNAYTHMNTPIPNASRVPAIDIGNGHCGEPIVSMAAGTAERLSEANGALGVRVKHNQVVSSEYWHFDRWAILPGAVSVKAGTVLGFLGSTGLGRICHCHIEIKINGVSIDPEAYIFGKELDVLQKEEDVTPIVLKPVIETWDIPTGTEFWLGGPGLGDKKKFSSGERRKSIGETEDGDWRVFPYGSDYCWIWRKSIRPVPGTRIPATGYALNLEASGIPEADVVRREAEARAKGIADAARNAAATK